MNNIEKYLKKDLLEIEKRLLVTSKSKKINLMFDASAYMELADLIGIDNKIANLNSKFYNSFVCGVIDKINYRLYDFGDLALNVIEMFKNNHFYNYENAGYASIDSKEKKEIIYGFLDYFMPSMINIYDDMVKSGKLFYADIPNAGVTCSLCETGSDYIILSNNMLSDLFEVETVIHELMHVYSFNYINQCSPKMRVDFTNSLLLETISLYSELSFYEYMLKNNLCVKEMDMHRNLLDYYILDYFKTIYYVVCADSLGFYTEVIDDSYIIHRNSINGPIPNKAIIDRYKGIPSFEFNKNYNEGSLNDFIYGISNIHSFNLMSEERDGEVPKNIINEYLQNFYKYLKDTDDIYTMDYSNMENDIKKRIKIMSEKYPIYRK